MKKLLFILMLLPFIGFSQTTSFGEKTGCTGDCTNGYGVWVYSDGARYEGNFKNGKKNGQGTLTSASGKKQSGKWKDGVYQTSTNTTTKPQTSVAVCNRKSKIEIATD
jgi:hypothetical protein